MSEKLKKWVEVATPRDREVMYKAMSLSHGSFRQLLYKIISKNYAPTPRMTEKLEYASIEARKANVELPILHRYDVMPMCARCPFALAAKKED